jgi:hypothetical protein
LNCPGVGLTWTWLLTRTCLALDLRLDLRWSWLALPCLLGHNLPWAWPALDLNCLGLAFLDLPSWNCLLGGLAFLDLTYLGLACLGLDLPWTSCLPSCWTCLLGLDLPWAWPALGLLAYLDLRLLLGLAFFLDLPCLGLYLPWALLAFGLTCLPWTCLPSWTCFLGLDLAWAWLTWAWLPLGLLAFGFTCRLWLYLPSWTFLPSWTCLLLGLAFLDLPCLGLYLPLAWLACLLGLVFLDLAWAWLTLGLTCFGLACLLGLALLDVK